MKSLSSIVIGRITGAVAAVVIGVPLTIAQNPTPLVTRSQADLLAVLRSAASLKEKTDACRELAVIGNKEAVDVLVPLLGDEQLSHMARYALESMPDPAVDSALRAALPQLKGRQLCGTIHTLGVRRDAEAVRLIAGYLSDSDRDVAQAAARALGDIGTVEAQRLLTSALPNADDANKLALCEGLLRCAENALKAGRPRRAIRVYDALRRQSSLPHQVRAGALRGAIIARGEGGLDLLKESLASQDYVIFAAAVRASDELKGPSVTTALVEALPKITADNQVVVLQALARRGDPSVLPVVADFSKNGSREVRLAAIRALAGIGTPGAVPVLAELMKAPESEIAQTARESLAAIPGREVDDVVLGMLRNNSVSDRLTALQLVGRRRMQSAVPELLRATSDSDARVRAAALKRLGEMAEQAQLGELLAILLRATEESDRSAAEDAITAVVVRAGANESAANAVIDRLGTAQGSAKASLVRILASIGGPTALRSVREACKDATPEVRAAAIRALGSWKTLDAAPDLLELAKNASDATDRSVALSAYLGLANNPDLPSEPRFQMCREALNLVQRAEHKKLLLAALGTIHTVDSLGMIGAYLDDSDTKEEASTAAVTVSEALLRQGGDTAMAGKIAPTLRKAAETTGNAELARRARALLRRVESR